MPGLTSETTRKESPVDDVELQTHQDARYSMLQHVEDLDLEEFEHIPLQTKSRVQRLRWWAKVLACTISILAVLGILAVWVLPIVLDKVVIPLMEWEARTFTRPVLALILIGSMALLPMFLIPSGPSMWLAGMMFGYGYGFLIIISGTLVGISIPFFISRMVLHARIQVSTICNAQFLSYLVSLDLLVSNDVVWCLKRWIQKWPKRAAIISIADQGDWLEQFRILLMLRVSPIPYALFNYAIATTNVKYGPYFFSSFVILVPETFVTIYSGRLLRTLAEAKNARQHLTPLQISYNVFGLILAVAVIVSLTVYSKRALKELEIKEHAGKQENSEFSDQP